MGRHRKPSRMPQRVIAGVAFAATGLSVSGSGAFAVARPTVSDSTPAGLPAAGAVPRVAEAKPTTVTVQRGDTLDAIGRRVGQSWVDLQRRNLELIPRADLIRPGMVLSLVGPLRDLPALAPAPAPVVASAPAPRPAPAAPAAVRPTPTPAVSAPSQSPRSEAIAGFIEAAMEMEGVPYRWGGKSASGVDCSGLVYLALRSVGLTNIYRTSASLRDWAIPISRAEARPGDLVFGPRHVGIYLGNGRMIDAPRAGTTVGVHNVYSNMMEYGRIPV